MLAIVSGCPRFRYVRGIFDGETDGSLLGSRVFVWGKNELFAAADFLNPVNAQGDVDWAAL